MPAPSDYTLHFRGLPVLVTGGAGFIGSHLAARLIELGARVRIIDDLSGGFRENVPAGAELMAASILDDQVLREAASGCRFVFHEAAMVSVAESVENPRKCQEINVLGTERVLKAAADAGVQRVVFAASAAAYGNANTLPNREDQPVDPQSPYAASKIEGEKLCAAFGREQALSTVCLRYFNIFGPRQNPNSPYAAVISAFVHALGNGKQPTIYGDGRQTRDFTHIDNVVHANLLAAANPNVFRGEIMNIGTGRRVSLLEVLEQMGRILRVPVKPNFAPPRAGDVRDSVADITRAARLLGYSPLTDFASGLETLLKRSDGTNHDRVG